MPYWILAFTLMLAVLSPLPHAPIFQEDCPGAPPPQLSVGTMARVNISGEGLDAFLRVRETPGVAGNVLVDMKRDDRFTVIGGPECADNFWWWQIVTDGGITGWSAEGTTDNYFVVPIPDAPPNPLPTAPDRLVEQHGSGKPITMAWRADGTTLAISTVLGIRLYNAAFEPGDLLPGAEVHHIQWSPDGKTIAGTDMAGGVYVWDIATGQQRVLIEPQKPPADATYWQKVFKITWSPDSARLATTTYGDLSVRFWDIASGTEAAVLNVDVDILAVAWHPSRPELALSLHGGGVQIWDTDTLSLITDSSSLQDVGDCYGLYWSPDGERLALEPGAMLIVWNPVTGETVQLGNPEPALNISRYPAVTWKPDSTGLVWMVSSTSTSFGSSTLLAFQSAAETTYTAQQQDLEGFSAIALACQPGTDQITLLAADQLIAVDGSTLEVTQQIKLIQPVYAAWDESGQLQTTPPTSTSRFEVIVNNKNQASEAIIGVDVELRDGDTRIPLPIEENCGTLIDVFDTQISPDGSKVVILALNSNERGCATLWKTTGEFITFLGVEFEVQVEYMTIYLDYFMRTIDWTPDSRYLYTTYSTFHTGGPGPVPYVGVFVLYDGTTGNGIYMDISRGEGTFATAWNSDFSQIAVLNGSSLGIWNLSDLAGFISQIPVISIPIVVDPENYPDNGYLAWSPDHRRLVGSTDNTIATIWDVATGTEQAVLTGHTGTIYRLVWSPDGTRVATAASDHTVRVWDAASGQLLITLPFEADYVVSLLWKPDSTQLAGVLSANMMYVWDVW